MVSKMGRKISSVNFDMGKARKWLRWAALAVFVLALVNSFFVLGMMLEDFTPVLADYMKRKAFETTGPERWALSFWGITMVFWMMYFAWFAILSPMIGGSEKRCPCQNCGGGDG